MKETEFLTCRRVEFSEEEVLSILGDWAAKNCVRSGEQISRAVFTMKTDGECWLDHHEIGFKVDLEPVTQG